MCARDAADRRLIALPRPDVSAAFLAVLIVGYTPCMESHLSNSRIAQRFVAAFLVMSVALFGSAGTLLWPEAWLYIMLHLSFSFLVTVWMKLNDPELLKKRMELETPAAGSWDRRFMWPVILLYAIYLVVPGLDAVRFGWSHLPLSIQSMALLLLASSFWLIFRVMQVNSFASPLIEVQQERHHRVIDSGPYAYVRHPMYSAIILYLFAMPVWLGSIWTLPLALLLSLIVGLRTLAEEKTLHAELDGYTEYTTRVRYRLFPNLW